MQVCVALAGAPEPFVPPKHKRRNAFVCTIGCPASGSNMMSAIDPKRTLESSTRGLASASPTMLSFEGNVRR